MGIFFIVAFFLLTSAKCEDIFQNSTNICETCNCTKNGSYFILDCKERAFDHILANWPPHEKTLIATFSYNNFTTLAMLPSSDLVREVVLDHCGIENLENGVFKAVKNVQFVDLSYNLLTREQIAPEKFKGPYNNSVYEPIAIKHLNLAHNKIHSLPHNLFEHMQDLEELNLEGNHFSVLDPPTQMALSSLPKLERLNLAGNDLTELVGDAIRSLGSLVELDLSSNLLDFVPETLALVGSHLEVLKLDGNPIFELTDDAFLGVTSVIELSLNNLERLKYVNANVFSPISNLRILKMSHNRNLRMIDREAFSPNQTLNELYIRNNSLEDLHYTMTNWSSLRILRIDDNPFICNCDLYNISLDLSVEIKRNKDGPICMHPTEDTSLQIYNLTENICGIKAAPYGLHQINYNFHKIRIVLLTVTIVFTIATIAVLGVVYLKYRRHRMNQNYPFITNQVIYNPLNNNFGA